MLSQKENHLHIGIGLDKVRALFHKEDQVKIEINSEDSIFKVILPGTARYKELEGEK